MIRTMNKIDKIRAEIERLEKENCMNNGEHFCMRRAICLGRLRQIISPMQEEPVSGLDNGKMPVDRWKEACKAASNQSNYRKIKGLTETNDDYFVDGVQWADEHPIKEPVSEDLSDYINELSKQFPEVSFAKLSRIAVRVAKWKEQQMVADVREAVKGKLFQFQMENVEAWGDDSNGEHVKLQGRVTFQLNNVDAIVDAIIKEIKEK